MQFASWRQNRRIFDDKADLAPAVVGHLTIPIGAHADVLEGYEWTGRSGRQHRRLPLDHFAAAAKFRS